MLREPSAHSQRPPGWHIAYGVLFTQTNPAVRPRTLRSLEQDMLQQGIPLFGTALNERDAFRAIFSFGGHPVRPRSQRRQQRAGGAEQRPAVYCGDDRHAEKAAGGARAPGGGCIMSGARPNIFDDVDLSGFAPRSEAKRRHPRTRKVSNRGWQRWSNQREVRR